MTNAKKHFGKAITPPLIKLSSLILNYGWIGCLWIVLLPVGLLGQNANQGFLDVLIVIKEPTCPGEADGIIKVNASGGDGQYTYKWGSGSESPTQTGLSSGLYSITVTDGAGSIASKYVPLNDPIALTIPSVQLQNPYEADNPELPWSGKPEGGMSPYTTINGAVLVIGDATIDQKDYELIIEPDKEVYTIEEGKSGITRAKVMALAKKRQVRQIPFIKVKDHNGCEVIRYLSPNRLSDVPKPIEVAVEPVESEAPVYPQLEGVELVYKEGIPKKLGGRSIKTGRRVIVDEDYIEIAVWDSEYVDGDTISLNLNGDWILVEYPLQRKKKKMRVKIEAGSDNHLILYAHNQGERPPNTAALAVKDGREEKRLGLSSNMNVCGSINIMGKK